MKNLNIRKYCIIGLGNVTGLTKLLSEISETDVAYVSGSGLVIATFHSAFHLAEIEDVLNEEEKSYIVFEMTPGFFSANIKDKKFQNTLFGGPIDNTSFHENIIKSLEDLKDIKIEFRKMDDMEEMESFEDLMDFLPKSNKRVEEPEPDMDDILDRINEVGYEKLTKKEKELLDKYSQSK
jgi:hypothetical protein